MNVFLLPDLGEGLTEAELVRWLVVPGDTVAVDQVVAEVETAKAVVEVPTPYGGVVAQLHGREGEVLAVGGPLVSVQPVGAAVPAAADAPGATAVPSSGSGNVLIGYGTSEAAPAGHGRRHRRGGRPAPVAAVPAAAPARRPLVVSPIVRDLARRSGLDLTALQGTGPGGLIVRADVQRALDLGSAPVVVPVQPAGTTTDARVPSASPSSAAWPDPRTGLPVRERVPLTGFRKAVAQTLTRSRSEIPEATTWVDVDATALLELRASLATPTDRGPGLLALVARFVVAGLARFPELNSRVDVDAGEVVHLAGVNLGIAVQAPRGLVVPSVQDAHTMSSRGLDAEVRRLTAAAREGSVTTAELTRGSFTLNNYGSLGVDGSAAIINHPEVAILGMGRVIPRPWVVDGQVVPRQLTQLSLVFDHRVCDGGTAGGFLRHVADCIERPLSALADL